MSYPGKKAAEATVRPAARVVATKIVQGRLQDAVGWWWLRQTNTRAELVDKGVISRAASYQNEKRFRVLIGKDVDEVSNKDLRDWVARIGAD